MPIGGSLGADIAIGNYGFLKWNNSALLSSMGQISGTIFRLETPQGLQFKTNFYGSNFTADGNPQIVLSPQTSTKQSIGFGVDYAGYYRAIGTTAALIERNLGKLLLSSNVGLAGGYGGITPNYQICIDGTNNNVAIGKGNTAGDASAKLEVASTTQGFLPPRMTAKQASAIASPAKSLIVYVTDTNGTFTSAGIWIYTTSWKLILAE